MIPTRAEILKELDALGLQIKNKSKRYRVIKDTKKALRKKYGIIL